MTGRMMAASTATAPRSPPLRQRRDLRGLLTDSTTMPEPPSRKAIPPLAEPSPGRALWVIHAHYSIS